jgi:flagellar L-ring protein precursor FlgH
MRIRFDRNSLLAVLLFAGCFAGCVPKSAQVPDPTGVGEYVNSARSQPAAVPNREGSLWTNRSARYDLFRDFKARDIDDTVTIRVVESVQALASADASSSRATEASAGFDALFGAEKKVNELPNMVAGKANSSFDAKGSTSRSTTLQAYMTARVVEVLPNGNLVVEGKREVRVNNENQILYITGVIRPVDISRTNVIMSSSVAQMAVRVQGKGMVSQPLKPGWLYRILSGVMPF